LRTHGGAADKTTSYKKKGKQGFFFLEWNGRGRERSAGSSAKTYLQRQLTS
jgi:hypothetical protein